MSFDRYRFEDYFGPIKNGIDIYTLQEVCPSEKGMIISGPFGSNISSKYFVETGVPVIRGNNLSLQMDKFIDDGFVFVTEEKADSLNTYAIQDDLIFTAAGTIGQVGLIVKGSKYDKYIISNKQLRARLNKDVVNPLYAYYWFAEKKMQEYIVLQNTGSTIPLINLSILRNLPIPLPSMDIQNKIVAILETIDNKIDINNQINRNLSEQSQMIVKSYMDSKEYKMTPLADIAEVIDCLHSKKPEEKENGTKQLIQLDNITDAGFLDMDRLKYMISDDDYAFWIRKCEIVAGDCVITNVGRVGAVSQAPAGTHAAMGRNMTCIRLKKQYEWQAYLITMLLSNHMKQEINKNTDVGTIMNALNVKDIPKLQFPVFSDGEMEKLEGDLKAIRGLIETNYLEIQRLIQLRDSLLPRLMSGELDVSDLNI